MIEFSPSSLEHANFRFPDNPNKEMSALINKISNNQATIKFLNEQFEVRSENGKEFEGRTHAYEVIASDSANEKSERPKVLVWNPIIRNGMQRREMAKTQIFIENEQNEMVPVNNESEIVTILSSIRRSVKRYN